MSVLLDTHAVLWFLVDSPQLSDTARTTVDQEIRAPRDVHVSAISLIETVYLAERQRLPPVALQRLRSALNDPQSGFVIVPVDMRVAAALETIPRNLVPDMPDRIIAATARHLGFPLITRDRRLRAAGIQTIW